MGYCGITLCYEHLGYIQYEATPRFKYLTEVSLALWYMVTLDFGNLQDQM